MVVPGVTSSMHQKLSYCNTNGRSTSICCLRVNRSV